MTSMAEQIRAAAEAALPPYDGELRAEGLREPVDVVRDAFGVPHITAANLEDLWFAQGFVTASERLFQIDLMLRMSNGRLATMFSVLMADLDKYVRTVGWNRAGRRIAASYDEESRAMLQAYVNGAHAWTRQMPAPPPEYAVLELEPDLIGPWNDTLGYWSAASVFMAWNLSGNFDMELLRAQIAERLGVDAVAELFPGLPGDPPTDGMSVQAQRAALELLRNAPPKPPGQGSNNWVVAGSKTATGKPLLANDPHLAVSMPSIWFECHLKAPGYEAAGVALPFSPGVVIGRTPTTAWGFTNVGGDTQDLYLERLNDDRTAARYEGAWEPLTIHREELEIRGVPEPEVLEVRESRHGPILESYTVGIAQPQVRTLAPHETFALRWVGHERAIPPVTLVRIARAQTFEEFREAVRTWECPGQNMVWASADDEIGYQCTGLYPVRRKGDGSVPVPGWNAEHEWDGWVPFQDLPSVQNPPEGFIATANHRITREGDPHIGWDFLPPFRFGRISELLAETDEHSRETFARIHMDTVSLAARDTVPLLLRITQPADGRQKEALALLETWNGDLAKDSAAAAIYQVWCTQIAEVVLRPKLGNELFSHYYGRREWTNQFQFCALNLLLADPSSRWWDNGERDGREEALSRALELALDELTRRLGDDIGAWRWGALHHVTFAHPLAMIGDVAELFTGGVLEIGGDEQTVLATTFEPEDHDHATVVAPSWRQIQDLSGPDASAGVHTTGQSGNPASPHWNDQTALWAAGEYHQLPLSAEPVAEAAAHSLRLLPG